MGRFLSPDWSASPTPVPYASLDNPQSLNLYGYVGNNPLARTDPDGHLFAHWHFGITFVAALRTGHGFFGSLKLAWKSTAVDFRNGSQGKDAEHTNIHAMRGKKADGSTQNQQEATEGTAQSVADAKKSGDIPQAVHTVEDQATPQHKDHIWNGPGLNGTTIKHVLGDIFPSFSTVRNAYKNAVGVLQPQESAPAPEPATPAPTSEPTETPEPDPQPDSE